MTMYRLKSAWFAAFAAGCIAGATLMGLSLRTVAHADTTSLPVIFQIGAQLNSPIGPLEIREIQGQWIRVKSLHVLAEGDSEHQWMYVPAMAGTWIPEDGS